MKPFLRIKHFSDEDQDLVQKLLDTHPSLHDGNGIITSEEVENIFDWDGDGKTTRDDFTQFEHDLPPTRSISEGEFFRAFRLFNNNMSLSLKSDEETPPQLNAAEEGYEGYKTTLEGGGFSVKLTIQYGQVLCDTRKRVDSKTRRSCDFYFGVAGNEEKWSKNMGSDQQAFDLPPGQHELVGFYKDKNTGEVILKQSHTIKVAGTTFEHKNITFNLLGHAKKIDRKRLKLLAESMHEINSLLDQPQKTATIWWGPDSESAQAGAFWRDGEEYKIKPFLKFSSNMSVPKSEVLGQAIGFHEMAHVLLGTEAQKNSSVGFNMESVFGELRASESLLELYKIFDESNYHEDIESGVGHIENPHELFASCSVVARYFGDELVKNIATLPNEADQALAKKILRTVIETYPDDFKRFPRSIRGII